MAEQVPFLYRKLQGLLNQYKQDYGKMNNGYTGHLNKLTEDIPVRFRIQRKEMPKLLKDMERYRQIERRSQRRVRIR